MVKQLHIWHSDPLDISSTQLATLIVITISLAMSLNAVVYKPMTTL